MPQKLRRVPNYLGISPYVPRPLLISSNSGVGLVMARVVRRQKCPSHLSSRYHTDDNTDTACLT